MRKRFLPLILILCLFLTGCSLDIKSLFVKDEEVPLSNLSAEALYFDGKTAREKTKELITSAQKSIYVEQKIFSDPELKALIIQKAASGIEIRILLDQFETPNKTTLNEFKSNNISVQYYPAQKGQTNEAKFLIVDLREAMVYSFPWTEKGFNSHNLAVHLSERSAWKLASTVFNRDWIFTTTLSLDIPKTTELTEDNISVLANTNIKQKLLDQIQKSTTNIWIIVSHVTDSDILQALIDAAAKGVDIKLIVDSGIMPKSYQNDIESLQAAGVQIRYYDSSAHPPLEINLGIFDRQTFTLSSSGWGYKAFVMNHEVAIAAPSPAASQELIVKFDQDWLNSSPTPPGQEPG
ncbi:phospholipase D-like domain-containing protein [Desulfitobacterium chlororespirans]|uniref:phospholipase D n=1 Tax=Desulfitobacterium chlororespirans DSM 11544 TaxID=1121395 RepID=A0A1M7UHQ7_9FIRM|nr:phospholipase D-like domain-containing protein [Desulfitobacterium chlororespirans]SHN82561.1 Phosphatidylserine/phosphatidylglycerophosphate/cardiolipin synthase [Desulfitobacterium chlororespirans DSM 11544]